MRVYRSGAGFGGRQTTSVVKYLLIANLAVFVLQILTRGARGFGIVDEWGSFVPKWAIYGGQVWRFVTYMFLHGGFFHLFFRFFFLFFTLFLG